METQHKQGILDTLTPVQTFVAGIILTLLLGATIGFFILLFGGNKTSGTATEVVQKNTQQAQQPQQARAGEGTIQLAAVDKTDWYKGAADAEITIVEYSDPECPFCKRFHGTMNRVITEYGDRVQWVYRHAPLDSLHSKARREAQAMECAGDIGGNETFWTYTDRLFEVTPSNDGLQDGQLFDIAAYAGLDADTFRECVESERFASEVQAELDDAKRAGLRGTPYSVIVAGEQRIPISGAQPYANVSRVIDSLLNS